MKKILCNWKKILIALLIVISLGANAYYFGWNKLVLKFQEEGYNIALNQILQSIKNNGRVQIGETILIPVLTPENESIK